MDTAAKKENAIEDRLQLTVVGPSFFPQTSAFSCIRDRRWGYLTASWIPYVPPLFYVQTGFSELSFLFPAQQLILQLQQQSFIFNE